MIITDANEQKWQLNKHNRGTVDSRYKSLEGTENFDSYIERAYISRVFILSVKSQDIEVSYYAKVKHLLAIVGVNEQK